MAARIANWIAIAIGGAGGTLAAIAGSAGPALAPNSAMPRRPIGEVSADVLAAMPAADAASAGSSAPVPNAAVPAIGKSAPSAAAVPALPPATAVLAAGPEPATSADTAPLPTSLELLLHAEMRCDQGKSEACIIAARSYESASAGVTDAEKAVKYRRIALTMWISHCDHNSAAACVTLSKMYRAGEGVPQSDRNADALVARARELCRYTDVPVCHELPNP